MCKIWDDIRNEGKEEGREEMKINSLKNVMENLNCTLNEAMAILKYPNSDFNKYRDLIVYGKVKKNK